MRSKHMGKYLFFFGHNEKLSEMELTAYLKSRGIDFKVIDKGPHFRIIDGAMDRSLASVLGGTVKIGEVLAEMDVPFSVFQKYEARKLEEELDKTSAACMFATPESFGVSVYPHCIKHSKQANWTRLASFFGSYFKERMKGCPDFMISSRKEPWLSAVEVAKKELATKNLEILVVIGRDKTYIGRTISVYNPFEFEKRDMGKFGRELLDEVGIMQPKLARILVNLSGTKQGETLLDPFCGSGTILCEAMLCGINALGTDINAKCVEAAAKNIEKTRETYELKAEGRAILGDARKIPFSDNQIDGIATEPYLGKLLWKTPAALSVEKSIKELRKLYSEALSEMRRVIKQEGKIVFITPVFDTRKGYIRLPMGQIIQKAKLKVIDKVLESREGQKVLREVWILEK